MAKKQPVPLYRFFPIQFPNGNVVKRFAKPCMQCGEWVELPHMLGVVKVRRDRAFLSANAECPKCRHRFAIDCMITPDKLVVRMHLPHAFMMWYLLRSTKMPEIVSAVSPQPVPPAVKVIPMSEVEMAVDQVGQYQGRPIPAAISYQGEWYDFERVAMKQETKLDKEELLLDIGLIFRKRAG